MGDVNVTVVGYAGNDPAIKTTKSDVSWTQFRVGTTRRWRDSQDNWVEGPSMWFTVKAWGSKADNICDSIRKGTPVVVTGRLTEEPFEIQRQTAEGVQVERRTKLAIETATVAIDLSRGVAKYVRTDRQVPEDQAPVGARNLQADKLGSNATFNQAQNMFADGNLSQHSEHLDGELESHETFAESFEPALAAA
jgi:single-strand DNA-binding protein